jgi:endonuclease/exonuclease/phosphatase family metal-dependent hydrolase
MAKNKSSISRKIAGWLLKPMIIIGFFALLISYTSPFIHPKMIWWIPLFGLAYPIIFWFNIISLILLFSLRRKRLRWVLLVILILGSPLHTRYFSLGSSKEQNTDKTTITIMSYNVRLFDRYQWVGDGHFSPKDSIIDLFKNEDPDILCLQEYLKDNSSKPFIRAKDISETNSYNYIHERTVQEQKKLQFGLATFSKYPIIYKGNVFNEQQQDQFCIFTDLKIGNDTIRVYNMHLQSIRFQKEDYHVIITQTEIGEKRIERIKNMLRKVKNAYAPRIEQTQQIIDHIKTSPYPVIACGDFNDTPLSFVYNLFSNELTDAFLSTSFGAGRTYAGRVPAGRIDYIFVDSGFNPLNFSIQKEVFSDHFAIKAALELGKLN